MSNSQKIRKDLKSYKPAGLTNVPFDPVRGHFLPLDPYSQFIIKEVAVVEEFDDYIKCRDDQDTNDIMWVAKPHILRISTFTADDYSRGSVTFTKLDVDRVQATDASYSYTENLIISPSYLEDDRVLIIFRSTEIFAEMVDTGFSAKIEIEWEDLNNSGRCWCMGNEY